jgi:glycosyltransferase involved in cell wall biosynthesis
MKVGLNALHLSYRGGVSQAGISNYELSLIRGIAEFDGENQYIVFCCRDSYERLCADIKADNVRIIKTPVRVGDGVPRFLWEQVILPFEISRYGIELFHGLHNMIPVLAWCKKIATVHDVCFLSVPSSCPPLRRLYHRVFLRVNCWLADRIIVVSQATKNGLREFMGGQRVSVVGLGVNNDIFKPVGGAKMVIRGRVLQGGFFLFVGTLEPRKNILRLLDAYARYCGGVDCPRPLVLCGQWGWMCDDIRGRVMEFSAEYQVVHLGWVSQDELVGLYGLARALVLPSVCEGFGLPVLEAMACGCPVLLSEIQSFKDFTAAAMFFDPYDVDGIKDALLKAGCDDGLMEAASERGLVYARGRRWEKTVRATLGVYGKVMGSGNV